MSIAKTSKYAFFGLYCTLVILLLTLSGCNTTSDPRPSYQATGSWQGTIGAEQVRGVIAPDRTYQLAIIDAVGNTIGAYVGTIGSLDAENIGSMTLIRLDESENIGVQQQFTFKLSADRLFSLQGVELTRNGEAKGPVVPGAVAGHWSLTGADNFTDVVVNADGTLSGSDGVNCRYSGTLNLLDPAWNIFSLNMTLTNISGRSCAASDYSGLAMLLPPENERRLLWFAANNRIRGGGKTLFGGWAETVNVAPVAQMAILGERADQSVLIQKIFPEVALDAQISSDANNDPLTYTWSGIDPDGNPLLITVANGIGSTAKFVPAIDPDPNRDLMYSITLTIDDGIVANTVTRQIRVEWTPDRFRSCDNGTVNGNGTVLDTRTNLLWLKNAGCAALNLEVTGEGTFWGTSALNARTRVETLLSAGICDLSDGSAAGDWRLPTISEFEEIILPTKFSSPPALLNGVGDGQWREGDVFVNVGTTHLPNFKLYLYWTDNPDPDTELSWFVADFDYLPEQRTFPYFRNNRSAIWPVRALRTDPNNPGLNEQCLPAPQP